jgi:Holliday junction resolvasome RuvABC endonuclease subunit
VKIVGYDQSLTSFGAACVRPGSPAELHRWQPPGKLRGDERLAWHLVNVEETARDCDLALVEGLAFGAKGSSLLDLAGLFTLVTFRLWQMGVPYAVVSPFVRAKYITGRAGANKEDCLVAVIKRFPGIDVRGNDMADALTLAAMGADKYGFPLAVMPADQRAVLTSIVPAKKMNPAHPAIAWPELRKGVSRAAD